MPGLIVLLPALLFGVGTVLCVVREERALAAERGDPH